MLFVRPKGCFPLFVREIGLLILGRIEAHVEFRREESHFAFNWLFDLAFHRTCVLPAAWDPVDSEAVSASPHSHGEGTVWHCRSHSFLSFQRGVGWRQGLLHTLPHPGPLFFVPRPAPE